MFTVIGTSGVIARSGADSARKKSSIWSESKRRRSTIIAGSDGSVMPIWLQSVKRCAQKPVHHAWLSASSDIEPAYLVLDALQQGSAHSIFNMNCGVPSGNT